MRRSLGMSSRDQICDIHAAAPSGAPGEIGSTDIAAGVLVHREEFLSLDEFVKHHVGAG
jgi:hypothetical protein